MDNYTQVNAQVIDKWCEGGWEWGKPISHETYEKAKAGEWDVLLSPTKPVPHAWFGEMKGKKILGLASGGAQQIPIFAALGAECTVLDYSKHQCESERVFAEQEGYEVTILNEDMTKPLPFEDETFDLIFHPVSNCYIEQVEPVFKECYRVLKKGGVLLGGYDIGTNYIVDEKEERIAKALPYNPLKDEKLYKEAIANDWGIQFSHTAAEQLGGQLKAGFTLVDLYEDTNGAGRLHEMGIPSFLVVCAKK